MSEGISERAVAVAPGLIRQRHPDFGAGLNRLIVETIYVFDIEMDPDRAASDTLRSESAHLGNFIVDEEYGIADFDSRMDQRATVRRWDPAKLFRVKGLLIKLDGLSRTLYAEVRSNGVGAFRDRVNFGRHFILRYWVVGWRTRFGFR